MNARVQFTGQSDPWSRRRAKKAARLARITPWMKGIVLETGAMVEALVHLELKPNQLPKSYRLLKAETPNDLPMMHFSAFTDDWRKNETASRTLGDEWLSRNQTPLLEVPSAILPETMNILLNPLHPDAARISVLWHEAYPFDQRLFKA